MTIAVEAIAVEMITVEAITSCADPGGGGVDRQSLLRRSPHLLILGGGGGELTPSRHSVRNTGWPLVKYYRFEDV